MGSGYYHRFPMATIIVGIGSKLVETGSMLLVTSEVIETMRN